MLTKSYSPADVINSASCFILCSSANIFMRWLCRAVTAQKSANVQPVQNNTYITMKWILNERSIGSRADCIQAD